MREYILVIRIFGNGQHRNMDDMTEKEDARRINVSSDDAPGF